MSNAIDAAFSETAPADPVAATPAPEPVQTHETPPAATPAPVATPSPEPAQAKQDHTVPLPTFLDMRDQLKATKAELAALKNQPAPEIPSAATDPEAFARYQADLVNSTRTNTVFDMSEVLAREKHGDEPVTQAMDWAMKRAQESPAFAAEYLKQKHPIDWAVKQQKRHALLDEIGDDPEAYKAKLIAAHTAAVAPSQPQATAPASPQPAPVQPKPPTPSPSLAAAPSAGGPATIPVGNGVAFEGVFQR